MDDYHILLKRYLNHTATPQERDTLLALIATGRYDNLLGNDIHEDLDDELEALVPASVPEQVQKERLYRKLLEDNAIASAPQPLRTTGRRWLWIAATIVMIVSIGGAWLYYDGHQGADTGMVSKSGPTFRGKNFIHLPDGSTVLLNEGSELSYAFGPHRREVNLRGEAFFDVVHNPHLPFIVHSGKVNTRVLGTAFNIRAYPGQSSIKVTVSRGEVQVGDAERLYGSLKSNEQFVVDTDQNTVKKNILDVERELRWQRSFLILDDLSMGQVAKILDKKYRVSIVFENDALASCRINAKFFNDEKLEEVLSIMGLVLQFEYEYTDPAHIVIRGKGCH